MHTHEVDIGVVFVLSSGQKGPRCQATPCMDLHAGLHTRRPCPQHPSLQSTQGGTRGGGGGLV